MAVNYACGLLVVFLSCFLRGCQGQIMSLPPVNRAVKAGSDMMWPCAAPDNIDDIPLTGTWYEFITTPSGQIISLNDQIQHPNPDHYQVNMKTENGLQHFDLDIYGCTSGDAGRYYCGPLSPTSQSNAFLIIIESELNCLDNRLVEVEEGDMITMQCQVDYTGLWGPITEWTDTSGGPVDGVIDESTPGTVLYTYNIVVDPNDDGLTIDCSLKFELPPDGVIPDNGTDFWYSSLAPGYTDTCRFDTLEVHYNPRDIVISTDPDHGDGDIVLNPGHVIKCEATGNPTVQFRWIDLDTGEVSSTDTVDVTAEMEGDRNYQCVAWNTIKGEERNSTQEFSFNVAIPTTTIAPTTTPAETTTLGPDTGTSSLSEGEIAAIAICSVIFVIIIIVLVIFLCRRKSKKDPGPHPGKPQHVDTIRTPASSGGSHPSDVSYISEKPPPYDEHDGGPPNRNAENLMYADLALDDTPRSRKPIQYTYEPTEYADIRRV